MRVISGYLRGRNISGFDIDGTRPTQDRVKESIFGSIQNYIDEAVVLDLFAGSGNLGIEAISNGASKCYFVDNNKEAIKTINSNISELKIDNAYVIKNDFKEALNSLKSTKFDIVFLDPPYKYSYIDEIVDFLIKNDMINDHGIIVCEYENEIKKEYEKLSILKEKKYGYKKVVIFKK